MNNEQLTMNNDQLTVESGRKLNAETLNIINGSHLGDDPKWLEAAGDELSCYTREQIFTKFYNDPFHKRQFAQMILEYIDANDVETVSHLFNSLDHASRANIWRNAYPLLVKRIAKQIHENAMAHPEDYYD